MFKDTGSFADKYVFSQGFSKRGSNGCSLDDTMHFCILALQKKPHIITKPIESLPISKLLCVFTHHVGQFCIIEIYQKNHKMCRSNLIRALRKKDIPNKDVDFLCYFLRQSETQMRIKQLFWQHSIQRYCLSYEFCHTL